eukprot:3023204-Amphidinium_carterae.2
MSVVHTESALEVARSSIGFVWAVSTLAISKSLIPSSSIKQCPGTSGKSSPHHSVVTLEASAQRALAKQASAGSSAERVESFHQTPPVGATEEEEEDATHIFSQFLCANTLMRTWRHAQLRCQDEFDFSRHAGGAADSAATDASAALAPQSQQPSAEEWPCTHGLSYALSRVRRDERAELDGLSSSRRLPERARATAIMSCNGCHSHHVL